MNELDFNELDFEEMVETIDNELQGIEFEIPKSQVYIQTDEQGRVIRCEGGYSMANITDIDDWILIDEGIGDKYNLCQSHYFKGGLYTMDGIPLYKWDGEQVVARGEDEIEADRAAIPKPPVGPTYEERLSAMESAILTMAMALGGDQNV